MLERDFITVPLLPIEPIFPATQRITVNPTVNGIDLLLLWDASGIPVELDIGVVGHCGE